jgi:oligopeptide/dipeptide ABC transporter ATP-binding protein
VNARPLLEVQDLKVHFPIARSPFSRGGGAVKAVDGVGFTVCRNEIVGLVGESGSGKTTIGRALLRLIEPTAGTVRFDGQDVTSLPARAMYALRRRMQIIFQDPYASLNPRLTVGDAVGEALLLHGIGTREDRRERVQDLLGAVGLPPSAIDRYPHEFSGGQRQRIGIARALAVGPDFVVADEPVSALDVSIQAQILNLLKSLQQEFRLTYVFISHDLSVIRQICDRIAVMYLGRVVEVGEAERIYEHPRHPYSAALLSAVPRMGRGAAERNRIVLRGDVPSPVDPPHACIFHPRCPRFHAGRCDVDAPQLQPFDGDHEAACHYPLEHWPMTDEEIRHAAPETEAQAEAEAQAVAETQAEAEAR